MGWVACRHRASAAPNGCDSLMRDFLATRRGSNMDLGIGGTVAIVTGASRGIGKAIAMALAHEGAQVAVCARNPGPLEETANEIRARTQSKIVSIPADISRHEDVKRLVATTEDELGAVYILVNNAVATRGPSAGRGRHGARP